ncbi:MAG: hypothetical protein AB7U20_02745, partial [Planctomycetaceae bacterium]
VQAGDHFADACLGEALRADREGLFKPIQPLIQGPEVLPVTFGILSVPSCFRLGLPLTLARGFMPSLGIASPAQDQSLFRLGKRSQ